MVSGFCPLAYLLVWRERADQNRDGQHAADGTVSCREGDLDDSSDLCRPGSEGEKKSPCASDEGWPGAADYLSSAA